MIRFESPIEAMAYPILHTISIEYDLIFDYQRKIGYQYGGYSTKKEWCRAEGKWYDGNEDDWNDSSWESELYRIDFVLQTEYIMLAIEIDGEQFHKYKSRDERKDDYLRSKGYDVLRVPASLVLNSFEFKQLVLRELEIIK